MTDVLVQEVDKAKEATAYGEAHVQVAREETKRLVIKLVAVGLGIFACLACLLSPVIVEFLKLLGAP